MGQLARLPIFFALEGKRCLVAGHGRAAAWKAELLSAAGASVHIFASGASDEMRSLASDAARGAVVVHERSWRPADFESAAIAVGECDNDEEAAQFASAARAAGVPVNVIDRPAFCDFAFGAIVNRSPLVIGISTDGAAPVFAQAVRARIETLIPKGFARWAEAARRLRPSVAKLALSFRNRRSFWEKFAERAVACADFPPTDADLQALLSSNDAAESGAVIIANIDFNDPELLTLRAVRALQSADVILFDRAVSAEILDFARREAKKMLIGTTAGARLDQPDETDARVIALAKAGRRVVYLRSHDAFAPNRSDEALAAAGRGAGVNVEIIPTVNTSQITTSRPEPGQKVKPRTPIRTRAS
jgi:uroporphyrin-III C-methyltransferase / precorrin-2 dehydrogenase / sirohydrochlorin ferrochelatase